MGLRLVTQSLHRAPLASLKGSEVWALGFCRVSKEVYRGLPIRGPIRRDHVATLSLGLQYCSSHISLVQSVFRIESLRVIILLTPQKPEPQTRRKPQTPKALWGGIAHLLLEGP